MSTPSDPRRALPSVDRLLREDRVRRWEDRWGRPRVVDAIREALDRERADLGPAEIPGSGAEEAASASDLEERLRERVLSRVRGRLERSAGPSLRTVLNGTGVVLHTNLGRAPLHPEAGGAARAVAEGYSNLEYDLEEGARGSRYHHCVDLLARLTGAESALVVNNNAAAVALAVRGLAAGRDVIVSRGELVEIGGSFRMPEVVESAGGRLVEVGTTNRTRPEDYEQALSPETGALLKVHPSNYRVEGFAGGATLGEVARIGERAGVPVIHDLGSGLLRPGLLQGFPPEPSPSDSSEDGADVATWSGDKLLGGPQAGILTGREEVIRRLRDAPLLRALRVDKMTVAALEATLRRYRSEGADELPALRALREPVDSVRSRAGEALDGRDPPAGAGVAVADTVARAGGGAYPGHEIPSAGWRVTGPPPDALAAACRDAEPPLVGRVADGAFWVDVRTLLPGQEEAAAGVLARALRSVAEEGGGDGGGESGPGEEEARA